MTTKIVRQWDISRWYVRTVYPKKYAHGFVVLCFVVVLQSFIMKSHEVFIHIRQGCFADTGAIVRLPQCQWIKPDGYGKISQCIPQQNTAKHKPCAYFLGYTVDVLVYVTSISVLSDKLIAIHTIDLVVAITFTFCRIRSLTKHHQIVILMWYIYPRKE